MIPYFNDLPAPQDRLNFQATLEQFLADLRHNCFTPPLTVGVLGAWGQGKSSFLRQVRESLAREEGLEGKYLCLEFQPWRYQKEPNLLVPLLLTVAETFKHLDIEESLHRVCASLIYLAGEAVANLSSGGLLNMEKIIKSLSFHKRPGRYTLSKARQELSDFIQCRDTLCEVFKKITDKGSKTVVFLIDDLDRCHPPEVAVELLEQIHLFFAQSEMPVIFVLAADPQALTTVLAQRFDADKARLYLEKYIQLPVHLPRTVPSLMAANIVLETLRGHAYFHALVEDAAFRNMIERLALYLYDTTRALKRFLNQVLFRCCARCGSARLERCENGTCGHNADSITLISLMRWLAYKDLAPAIADDPVLLRNLELEIKDKDVRQDDLAAYLRPHTPPGKTEALARFLLATRQHAVTKLKTIQDLIFSAPVARDGAARPEDYRHLGMRESIENAHRRGQLQGNLERLEGLDLQHMALENGNLSKTTFQSCNLSHALLRNVDFTDSIAVDCTFSSTDLRGITWGSKEDTTLNIMRCTFEKAMLEGSAFKGVEMNGCTYQSCTLKNLTLEEVLFSNCSFPGCKFAVDTFTIKGTDEQKRETIRGLLRCLTADFDSLPPEERSKVQGAVNQLYLKYSAVFDADMKHIWSECQGAPPP